jgi:hypothetical protein
MLLLGGMSVSVDGEEVDFSKTMTYRGMMATGVPNAAFALGYTNASWTLKCDLTHEYVCRVLNHMDRHGYSHCVPENRDPSVTQQPMIDFSSGYIQRSIDKFPKQGSKAPWKLYQNYALDIRSLRRSALEDGALQFYENGSRLPSSATGRVAAAA